MSCWLFCSWNTSEVRDYFDKVTENNTGPYVKNASEKLLLDTLLEVMAKFVYFTEDKTLFSNYTQHEHFIFDNFSDYIPELLKQVI